MNAINKWFFKTFCKKQPKPYESYIAHVIYWVAGTIFGGLFILLSMAIMNGWESMNQHYIAIIVDIFLLIVSLYYFIFAVIDDKKSGAYKSIHEIAVKRWHTKRQEYGLENEVSNDN